jgi:OB-fold nucleic acid binding domain.
VVTPEFSGNVYIYSLKKGSGGQSATEGADGSKIVTVAEFNAAPESNDVWYQLTGTVKNLNDGDKYGNFDLEDSTGSVYVYGVLSEKGGEKKKFQELVAAKGIKNGSKITIVGTRGSYQDKIEVMNAYFISVSN